MTKNGWARLRVLVAECQARAFEAGFGAGVAHEKSLAAVDFARQSVARDADDKFAALVKKPEKDQSSQGDREYDDFDDWLSPGV